MSQKFGALKPISLIDEQYKESTIRDSLVVQCEALDLGDLKFIDKERLQEDGSRLDLLFEDFSNRIRYTVELQRGILNSDHIGRAIEYWAQERAQKKNTKYKHCAVIIAETILARSRSFLKALDGIIPFVAIEIDAFSSAPKQKSEIADKLWFSCKTILDTRHQKFKTKEPDIKNYKEIWTAESKKLGYKLMKQILNIIKNIYPDKKIRYKYNKIYVGLTVDSKPTAFVSFKPQRKKLVLQFRLPESEEKKQEMKRQGLKFMRYTSSFRYYEIDLLEKDIEEHKEYLRALIIEAYTNKFG